MEPVPQKVLSWLYRVLQAQYEDVNRTYGDSAQILTQHKSLRPSTDVYTFEDGRSALLLRLAGTLPVNFRGAVYAFPITIWLPYEYPRAAPIAMVTPSKGMRIRPGQHVSGDGRIYHPFLASWRPDRSNMLALVGVLQEVFAHEPPVVATQEQAPPQGPPPGDQNGAPPRPPLPPELNCSGSTRDNPQVSLPQPPRPPQLPPKPFQEPRQGTPQSPSVPPVPPRPTNYYEPGRPDTGLQGGGLDRPSSTNYDSRYSQAPPLPNEAPRHQPPAPSYHAAPGPQIPGGSPPPPHHYQQLPPQQQVQYSPQQPYLPAPPQPYPQQHYQQQPHPQAQPPQQYPQSYPPHPQPPAHKLPPADLLSDPFDQPLPTHSAPLPAPPIPPNPEKDALLRTLSQTLTSRLQSAVHTNASALQPLGAQHAAMQAALQNLQGEQAALGALSSQLASNSEQLGQAMRDADACIARAGTASVPGLDEVLVAPTVVGQQMYDLVAEVAACQGAREVLGRALDKGRIGAESWVRAVRGIAREEFLKRVMLEKAARGMGLRVEAHSAGGYEGGWI